jgi:hypothetical protein
LFLAQNGKLSADRKLSRLCPKTLIVGSEIEPDLPFFQLLAQDMYFYSSLAVALMLYPLGEAINQFIKKLRE